MRYLSLYPLLALLVLLAVITDAKSFFAKRYKKTTKEDQTFWRTKAQAELNDTLKVKLNENVAKNVILFLGDGMSIPTLTASRIYKGQLNKMGGEEGFLSFEKFPHVGLSKTYNVNKQVADSASTATAYLTGVKTNYKTIGVDGTAIYQNCSSATEANKVYSIVKWAQDAGKRTGVVTSTRVTHATPAGTYAHVVDRDWECDGAISKDTQEKCPELKDIARQLVEDEPGASINVVMGGGYQNFDANATGTADDPIDTQWGNCSRRDDKNLINTWKAKKNAMKVKNEFVRTKTALDKVDLTNTQFLLGIFANGHVPYEYEKKIKKLDVPTLAQMTEAAIKILQQEPKGYFLLVEGGRIDHAHHDGIAHRALDETVAMDEAVETALNLTDEKDTLIVVTADHSHTMSISGYPARGQEIIGLAAKGDDDLPYTTLMYANGPGYSYSVNGTHVVHPLLSNQSVSTWNYTQLAAIPLDSETHGGDDVAIYALGPMAHLFHTLHEQNYIAHAMAYAACIGANTNHCKDGANSMNPPASLPAFLLPLLSAFWFRY